MSGPNAAASTNRRADVGDGAAIYANASYLVGIDEHADGNAYDGKLGARSRGDVGHP